ncbi:MAG: hypothetical protein ACYTGR_01075 [Planctomycetota bacterium]|jgi:hypothetical protein
MHTFARIKCVLFASALISASAHADFTVNIAEVGNDVVVTSGGTLDLSTWQFFPGIGGDLFTQLAPSRVFLGEDAFNVDIYAAPDSFAGPSSIPVLTTGASSGIGDSLGFDFGGTIYTPTDYVPGSSLASTDTYLDHSFVTLGLTAGETYTWTWLTAAGGQDSFTINIVPSPAALAVFGLFGVAAGRRRR